MNEKELIEQARKTVALITSYSKDTQWAKDSPLMYQIFQERAESLNNALGDNKFNWDEYLDKN